MIILMLKTTVESRRSGNLLKPTYAVPVQPDLISFEPLVFVIIIFKPQDSSLGSPALDPDPEDRNLA